MTRLTIQWRVLPGGPHYRFLPPSDREWSRYQTIAANSAKRRLTRLRRTLAYLPTNGGLPRHKLFEFRIKPPTFRRRNSAGGGKRNKQQPLKIRCLNI